jgi:hypothetical protein
VVTPTTTAPCTARQPDTVPASPLFMGGKWFEANGLPCLIQMELPVSAEDMVAALYRDRSRLLYIDLGTDEGVWGSIAVVVVYDGLGNIRCTASQVREQEQSGTLDAPGWLTYCRRRVAAVVGQAWQARKHRCSCGYAADEVNAFDEHLSTTEGMEPEHFETLDGWSLDRVLAWQPAMTVGASGAEARRIC